MHSYLENGSAAAENRQLRLVLVKMLQDKRCQAERYGSRRTAGG